MQITLYYRGVGDGVKFTPIYPLMFQKAFIDHTGINTSIIPDKDYYDYEGVPADNFFKQEYQKLLEHLNRLSDKPISFKDMEIDFPNSPDVDIYGTTTSAGCKYACKFCPNKNIGFVERDHDKVIKELDWLCKNTSYFEFFDNNVLLSNTFLDVIEFIPRHQRWGALINVTEWSEELEFKLKKMYFYGCRNIYLGVETFNEDDLNYFGKPYAGKIDPKLFMAKLQDIGFNIYAFLIRGLPNETEQDFNQMLQYLESHDIFYAITRFFKGGKPVTKTKHLSKEFLRHREVLDAYVTEVNLKKFLNKK